jgi:hypothetical protein
MIYNSAVQYTVSCGRNVLFILCLYILYCEYRENVAGDAIEKNSSKVVSMCMYM